MSDKEATVKKGMLGLKSIWLMLLKKLSEQEVGAIKYIKLSYIGDKK